MCVSHNALRSAAGNELLTLNLDTATDLQNHRVDFIAVFELLRLRESFSFGTFSKRENLIFYANATSKSDIQSSFLF